MIAFQQHTSFGGKSTILLPSTSLMDFSRLKRILSRMLCTTSIALGSLARNGIVIKLDQDLWIYTQKVYHALTTGKRQTQTMV